MFPDSSPRTPPKEIIILRTNFAKSHPDFVARPGNVDAREYAATMSTSRWLQITTAGVFIAVALLLVGAVVLSFPAKPTLQFDGPRHQPQAFNETGPTRLLLRMTHGELAQIVSVRADPAESVRILAHPGACMPDRTLTLNLPVCALWIEPGTLVAQHSAKVRVAYRLPGKSKSDEVVLRMRAKALPLIAPAS